MKYIQRILVVLFLVFLLFACTDNNEEPEPIAEPNPDTEYLVYEHRYQMK